MMKEFCEISAEKYKVRFHYEDYREGWQEGSTSPKNRICIASSIADAYTRKKKDIKNNSVKDW